MSPATTAGARSRQRPTSSPCRHPRDPQSRSRARPASRDAGEAFRPEDTYNPVFQRFFALLRARALDPSCSVEAIDDVGKETTSVPGAVLKRAHGPARRFAEQFPTKPAGSHDCCSAPSRRRVAPIHADTHRVFSVSDTEARAKRRRTWNDVAEDATSASAAAAAAGFDVDAKRQRGAAGDAGASAGNKRGSASINVQALFSGAEEEVNEVGAATPVNDFRALLERRDADFTVPGAPPLGRGERAREREKERRGRGGGGEGVHSSPLTY